MDAFLICLSAVALWFGLCAAMFRGSAVVTLAVHLIRRHGGRHAR